MSLKFKSLGLLVEGFDSLWGEEEDYVESPTLIW